MEAVEIEAKEGYLKGGELWMFTNNMTAESCFFWGSSSSKLLYELVLHLRRAEMEFSFVLHVVHVAGTRMIAHGTDGLSRGTLLDGVLSGNNMLSYVDLLRTAIEQYLPVLDYVQGWLEPAASKGIVLEPEEWFVEGHGIIGGKRDNHRIWIPLNAKNKKAYIWSPAPVIADITLEECMKAVHKRMNAFHVFLIPRLYSPLWLRMLYKLSELVFKLSPGSRHWPKSMHKPLFVGILLPLLSRNPWTLQRMPLLVGVERNLHQVLSTGEANGGDI